MVPVFVSRLQPAPFLAKKYFGLGVRRRRFVAARTQNEPVVNLEISREENPGLVLDEQAPHALGIMPSQLRDARRKVRHHIRITGQRSFHPFQLFGVIGEVDADKCSFRVPRDHAIERFQQFLPRRKPVGIAKPPVFMVLQFVPALVFFIVGQPKCSRIGHVDRNRHVQFPAAFPHRIELRIIHLEKLAFLVPKEQTEPLVFLETGRAETVPLFDLFDCPFRKIRLIPNCGAWA